MGVVGQLLRDNWIRPEWACYGLLSAAVMFGACFLVSRRLGAGRWVALAISAFVAALAGVMVLSAEPTCYVMASAKQRPEPAGRTQRRAAALGRLSAEGALPPAPLLKAAELVRGEGAGRRGGRA